ncbi:MAG: type I-MYXAN CRISPR-associated protein Cas6/Cmx6 [Rubrivivax sp.]|nr:type I-MYXAN CRISPR-associated protein Cas6/Cmx6 [Rubrivivax sp.]
MVDLAFALQGRELPRAHRAALAAALQRVLPWLVEGSGMAVHRLNIAAGGGPMALLSGRTRLTLRLPRARLGDAEALSGATLQVAGHSLRVGASQQRELLPFGTLYAHFVAADECNAAADELAFLDQVAHETAALGVRARAICGRHQAQEDGALGGYGLMLDGLDREAARRVLEHGIGAHRLWGCGVFVPHRSASAVGQPD